MTMYATIISGGAVLGQALGGLLVSANIFGSSWRPVFLVNVPVGLIVLACGWLLPARESATGSARLTCPVSRCLRRWCSRSCCRWCSGSRSAGPPGAGAAGRLLPSGSGCSAWWSTGSPAAAAADPAALAARAAGMAAGLGGLFATMAIFGGRLFSLALELQDALGELPLRVGLTFVPCGVAFALVSLNWRRLPARYHDGLAMTGFVLTAVGLLGRAACPLRRRARSLAVRRARGGRRRDGGRIRGADDAGALAGAGGARGGRQRRGRDREPAGDRGRDRHVRDPVPEPGRAAAGTRGLGRACRRRCAPARRVALSSAHAYLAVAVALAVLAVAGVMLALLHVRAARAQGQGAQGQRTLAQGALD